MSPIACLIDHINCNECVFCCVRPFITRKCLDRKYLCLLTVFGISIEDRCTSAQRCRIQNRRGSSSAYHKCIQNNFQTQNFIDKSSCSFLCEHTCTHCPCLPLHSIDSLLPFVFSAIICSRNNIAAHFVIKWSLVLIFKIERKGTKVESNNRKWKLLLIQHNPNSFVESILISTEITQLHAPKSDISGRRHRNRHRLLCRTAPFVSSTSNKVRIFKSTMLSVHNIENMKLKFTSNASK